MRLIKNNLVPVVIILLAAALVILLVSPLESTGFAEGIRASLSAEGARANEGAERSIPAFALVILPVFKVVILMGVGVVLTSLGLWMSRLGRKR